MSVCLGVGRTFGVPVVMQSGAPGLLGEGECEAPTRWNRVLTFKAVSSGQELQLVGEASRAVGFVLLCAERRHGLKLTLVRGT